MPAIMKAGSTTMAARCKGSQFRKIRIFLRVIAVETVTKNPIQITDEATIPSNPNINGSAPKTAAKSKIKPQIIMRATVSCYAIETRHHRQKVNNLYLDSGAVTPATAKPRGSARHGRIDSPKPRKKVIPVP